MVSGSHRAADGFAYMAGYGWVAPSSQRGAELVAPVVAVQGCSQWSAAGPGFGRTARMDWREPQWTKGVRAHTLRGRGVRTVGRSARNSAVSCVNTRRRHAEQPP